MAKILCSTGALLGTPNQFNYRLLKEMAAELSCDGFEFMMFTAFYDKTTELAAFLRENRIDTPVVHCDKHIGEFLAEGTKAAFQTACKMFECNCRLAEQILAEKLVLHLWNGRISDQYFSNNLKAYRELREISEAYGLDLLVENVVCNKETPMKHWVELREEYPEIHFIFDTKMAAFHGEENLIYETPFAWLWQENRIRHFHVNDYGSVPMDWTHLLGDVLPVGKGQIDFARFFEFIRQTGYDETFTVEATAYDEQGRINYAMLNDCFDTIRGYWNVPNRIREQ